MATTITKPDADITAIYNISIECADAEGNNYTMNIKPNFPECFKAKIESSENRTYCFDPFKQYKKGEWINIDAQVLFNFFGGAKISLTAPAEQNLKTGDDLSI